MFLKKVAISLLSSGLVFATAIPFAAAAMTAQEASQNRCNETAGREKARCLSLHRRNTRMKLVDLDRHIGGTGRGQTLREQRVLHTNTMSNTRRVNTYDMERLRTHDRDGGRARRQIMLRAASAREECAALKGTEKAQCIRKEWGAKSKGQTR